MQQFQVRAYKFRLYPSRQQIKELNHHIWISKELWNRMLEEMKGAHQETGGFPSKQHLMGMVKSSGLYSQAGQMVAFRLLDAVKRKIAMKKKGIKAGFPRFKSFYQMKSLNYPQFGFSLNDRKLKVTPFGEIPIKRHREMNGNIKTLTLKREQTGKWFAIFTAMKQKPDPKPNNGQTVGVDLGLMNFVALSDGTIIKNPRHFSKLESRLAMRQRELSKKKKGSKNRGKARLKVARVHEAISNARKDYLHKTANFILSKYSLIAMEGLQPQKMAMQGHGKGINDAAWGMFANILSYKAESAGSGVVFVNPMQTSSMCSRCGAEVQKSLHERVHNCPACGLSIDRDINAAINILNRATGGTPGSNACEDGAIASSVKQEVHSFNCG